MKDNKLLLKNLWTLVYGEKYSPILWPDKTTLLFLCVIKESRVKMERY